MADTDSSYYNIIISSGITMSNVSSAIPNYQYTYIDFNKIQCITWDDDYTDSKYQTNNYESLRKKLSGKQAQVWIHYIKNGDDDLQNEILGGSTKYTAGLPKKNDVIVGPGDIDNIGQLPCGFHTKAGSLIPQIIVPSETYSGIDNGLIAEEKKIYKANIGSKGYNWSSYSSDILSLNGLTGTAASSAAAQVLTHGTKNKEYISNKQSLNTLIDYPTIAQRVYSCTWDSSFGCFAFCYDFGKYNQTGEGKTAVIQNVAPVLRLTMNASGIHSAGKDEYYKFENITSYPVKAKIDIPPNKDIKVQLGQYKNEGSLSAHENSYVPPQCKKIGNKYDNTPLFIYPLYSGLIITNSCKKDKDKSQQSILVNFPLNGSYFNHVSISGVDKDDYISSSINAEQGFDMKFFPCLIQQLENNKLEDAYLQVKPKDLFQIGSEIKVDWIKSVGNFAICPIFFHRDLYFSLLFKGQYVEGAKKKKEKVTDKDVDQEIYNPCSTSYYIYPMANYSLCGSVSIWSSGFNGSGVSCVHVPGIFDKKEGNNGIVCIDSDLQQAIYRADFRFTASNPLTYPLQVFGLAVVCSRGDVQFQASSANGSFYMGSNTSDMQIISQFNGAVTQQDFIGGQSANWLGLMTNLSINANMDGVTGKMSLDGYPISQGIHVLKQHQSVGQVDLDLLFVESKSPDNASSIGNYDTSRNPNSAIFKGYGMQIGTNNSENANVIEVQLYGAQRKMSDMKLVCAPFWDGDRLQQICCYFQNYLNLELKMINYQTSSFVNASAVNYDAFYGKGDDSKWIAKDSPVVGSKKIKNQYFRVPSSPTWQSPAINFTTGTPCLQALQTLAEKTGCVFVVGLNGVGYFYELNKFGIPFFVFKQPNETCVKFSESQIVNINISPYLENKYNSIATFGFLQAKLSDDNGNSNQFMAQSVKPGLFHMNITSGQFRFPWARHNVNVQNGYFTKTQLYDLHQNRIKFAIADTYQGNVTVIGNTKVYYIYQKINICGIYFFIQSIDHNIDLQTKNWTTSYQITYVDSGLDQK